jgi:hypothetical protein
MGGQCSGDAIDCDDGLMCTDDSCSGGSCVNVCADNRPDTDGDGICSPPGGPE